MKVQYWLIGMAVFAVGCDSNETTGTRTPPVGQRVVLKGEIHYAVFQDADGKASGWTSIDDSKAVPGGNGAWNEHRHGELYDQFLVVTKPGQKDWGTLVIPTSRLMQVQFK